MPGKDTVLSPLLPCATACRRARRMDAHLTRRSAVYTSPPSGSYSRSAAATDEPQYIAAYHPTASDGMAGAPGAPPGQHVQQPVPDACYEAPHSHNRPPAQGASCQQYQYGGGVMPPRHGVSAHYEMRSSPAAPGPVLQHHRHGVVLGSAAAEQAMTPRAGGKQVRGWAGRIRWFLCHACMGLCVPAGWGDRHTLVCTCLHHACAGM